MCLWNTDAPGGNKVKIYMSYIFTLHQGARDISEV